MKPTNQTHEHNPPRSFRERLMRLAGESGWREPVEGASTRVRALPAAHELAASLGMARARLPSGASDPRDVGPDIAEDVLFGQTRHAGKVCREVAAVMAGDRNRAARRCRPYLRIVVWAAYAETVHGQRADQLRPSEMSVSDWDLLNRASLAILETLAGEAIGRAAKAWRRAA